MKKINLFQAILINFNVILGAGIFLNIQPLTKIAGPFGFLGYVFSSLILLPFVYSLGKLSQLYPSYGGLYFYVKENFNSFLGFISGWSFFIGKTVSAAFLALAFVKFIQFKITFLQSMPSIALASLIIFLLIFLNMLGTHIGGKIQLVFSALKLTPIIFIFFSTLLIPTNNFSFATEISPLMPIYAIPISIYALMGFETTCAIGHMLKKPKENLFKTIMFSFLIVAGINIIFQFLMFNILGQEILQSNNLFVDIAEKSFFPEWLGRLMISFIFTSVIAGSFGILTSNCWNLYSLVQDGHFPFKKHLIKLCPHKTPYVLLIIEATIACATLAISQNQIALQTMAVFGVVVSFLLNSFASFALIKKTPRKNSVLQKIVSILAISGCFYILFLCLRNLQITGVSIPFIVLLISGIAISLLKKQAA